MKDPLMKISKIKITTHVVLLALSGVCAITVVNILLPLAIYSKYFKAAAVLIGFGLTSALFYFLYLRFFRPILSEIGNHWLRNGLIAAAMTVLILSLAPRYLPYHPVEHAIQIATHSPGLSFSHIVRDLEGGPSQSIKAEELEFNGAWNHGDGFAIHQGKQPAGIDYQKIEYVRESLTYHFSFQRQAHPTFATITIDGQIYSVEIDAADEENQSYGVSIAASNKISSSRFWQLWMIVFPYFSALTLLIFIFFGVSYLLSNHKKTVNQIVQLLLFWIFLYLFWLTLNYQNSLFNYWTFKPAFPFIALAFFILLPLLMNLLLKKYSRSKIFLLVLIFVLAAGLRIYWILMVPTAQVSDFGRFHRWALQLASGEPGLTISYYANFTRLLSVLYRFFPTDKAVEMLNIFFSLGTMVCLYLIGKINHRESAGIIAAYLFAIFPSQIAMVTIVNTDIPAVFFLTLSVCLLTCFIQRNHWVFLFFSAAAFGISYIVRGALLVYFPMLFLPFVFVRKKKQRTTFLQVGVIIVGFISTVGLLNGIIDQIKVENMVIDGYPYLMVPFVKGTNIEALGRSNPEDAMMVINWPVEDVTKNGLKVITQRIFSDPVRFYSILSEKFEFQFADATYGANLAFYDENHEYLNFKTGWNYPIDGIREGFAQFSQYAYLCILLAAVLASLKVDQSDWPMTLPVWAILLCSFGAYTFFEVQPRYSRPIIPFLILLAGLLFTTHSRTEKLQN